MSGRKTSERLRLEQIVGEPIVGVAPAEWGFTNRTDIVTVRGGRRLVVQQYRKREDAEYRLHVMRALRGAGADDGVVIPEILTSDLDAEPAWAVFAPLPGVPVIEAGNVALDGPRFPEMARHMGALLARFRQLPIAGLRLTELWAHPKQLAANAEAWARTTPGLEKRDRGRLAEVIATWTPLFEGRPAVLAHGDFVPMNVLVDLDADGGGESADGTGEKVTGLLDFESVRLADPLFDVAWWAWAVGFHDREVLARAWRPFLDGAAIDPDEPHLAARIHTIQVLRLLEIVADPLTVSPDIREVLLAELSGRLRRHSPRPSAVAGEERDA
jgi:aminoglycoside phosphotransferase (APT) family kinase protein